MMAGGLVANNVIDPHVGQGVTDPAAIGAIFQLIEFKHGVALRP